MTIHEIRESLRCYIEGTINKEINCEICGHTQFCDEITKVIMAHKTIDDNL